jgi:hypothetical protein
MPKSSAESWTTPIIHKSLGRIGYEIVVNNQSVGGIAITGSFRIDKQKFESGKGLIECLVTSSNVPPNIPNMNAIQPQFDE